MPYTIAADGVRLHYELHDYTDPWKKAPVLILLHGIARSSRFWYNMAPYLSRFYKVVCVDLRGSGQSSSDFDLKAGITIQNYISDILRIADALGVDNFHYAGESLGGIIGFVLAAEHPKRVRTLTTFGAPLALPEWLRKAFALTYPTWVDALRDLGSMGWSKTISPTPAASQNIDTDLFEWHTDEMGKTKTEVFIAMAELVPTLNAAPFLKHIQCPVLGVYPPVGPTPPDHLEIMKQEIPNFQLVMINTPPVLWAQVFAPATSASHLLHFISTHDGVVAREF